MIMIWDRVNHGSCFDFSVEKNELILDQDRKMNVN